MHHLSAIVTHRPAAVRALSSAPGALVLIGRGKPPRTQPQTTDAEVLRAATSADEILRLGGDGLAAHPHLVVLMGAQMVVEIHHERQIIMDRILDMTAVPRVFTTAEVQQMAHDIGYAERDEDGVFAWSGFGGAA